MGRSPPDRAWIPADLRQFLDALMATAIGTLAGILVDSGFGVRDSIVDAVLRLLGPLFDVFSDFPNAQLVAAGFIDRMPIVLIVGMAVGMVLRHIRNRRLLLWSTLIWLAYLLVGQLGHAQIDSIAAIAGYLMQYAFLVLMIRATDAVAARSDRRKPASPA
jgi:hypothetical protein